MSHRIAVNKLLEFVLIKLNQEINDLAGSHIGAAYITGADLGVKVAVKANKILEFLNYVGWCHGFIEEGQTLEEFIDWQLDRLNHPSTDEETKKFIKEGLDTFYSKIS
jgi:hypothetical protein